MKCYPNLLKPDHVVLGELFIARAVFSVMFLIYEPRHYEKLVKILMSVNLFTDIPDIPEDIKKLRALQIADFSSNPIPRLPAGFSQLRALTVLGLNDMSLTSLPSDFGR